MVVQDELDLPLARVKVKQGGGLAGHNGLRSIKSHLHTDEFLRVRIGVGKPADKDQGADHVLKRVSKRDRVELDIAVQQAADAVELIVSEGIDAAMNRGQHGPGLTSAARSAAWSARAAARRSPTHHWRTITAATTRVNSSPVPQNRPAAVRWSDASG